MERGFNTSILSIILILVICSLYSFYKGEKIYRRKRVLLCFVVCVTYIISAYIASLNFSNSSFYLLSDPAKYINLCESAHSLPDLNYLYLCYFNLADNDALYNVSLEAWAYYCNTRLDGVTPFSLSLISVLFGSLSAITLFRVLTIWIGSKKAYRYTLLFALCSLFHFYSIILVRDIVITFFYLRCFEIISKRFSFRGVLLLLLFMLLTIGVRLYSGAYIIVFLGYYLYKSLSRSKARYLLIPLIAVALIGVIYVTSDFSSELLTQAQEEIEGYDEFTAEMTEGGISGRLFALPPVIKQISLTLYSQMTPFPPFIQFQNVASLKNLYMSLLILVYEVWWYFVFFSLLYVLIINKRIKYIGINNLLLYLIAIIFIVVCTAHPDARRMMPVYPIIYCIYCQLNENGDKRLFLQSKKPLSVIYISLLAVYYVIKVF